MPEVPPPLWPHQREAVESVAELLPEEGRGRLVAACGTGKTRIGAEVMRTVATAGRRLLLAPTVMLLTQTLRTYRQAFGAAGLGRVLVVCGDRQIGAEGRAAREGLVAQRVRVSTDPTVIAEAAAGPGPGPVTVLATYASLGALAEAHRDHGLPAWDLVIADEAHRTTGIDSRAWARVHRDVHLPARQRLYMTATPKVITGHGAAAEVVGMDDEGVFGPLLYRLGFATAIDLGLLASYRMVVAVITDAEIRALTGSDDSSPIQMGAAAISARMLAAQIALTRTAVEFGLHRAITYHTRVADARAFAATFAAAAELLPPAERPETLWAGDVHGAQSMAQRDLRLRRLRDGGGDGLSVVSNARLLSEGIDVPAVDAVMFCDPRASTVEVIQAIGRALRLGGDPDKVATVIVPVLSAAEKATTAVADSAYAPIWQITRALAAHDDGLAAELNARRRTQGSHGELDSAETAWTPHWLQTCGSSLPAGFAQAVGIRVIHTATAKWEEYYGAALAYRAEHGNLLIPRSWTTPTGLKLGEWIKKLRLRYKNKELTSEQIRRLEFIEMVWYPHEAAWDSAFDRLVRYKERNGHLRVHAEYRDDDGYYLGSWFHDQIRNNAMGCLPESRHRRLEDLGVDLTPPRRALWEHGLAAAFAYATEHGHLRVPSQYVTGDGFPLGVFIHRKKHLNRTGALPVHQGAALDRIDPEWSKKRKNIPRNSTSTNG